MVATEQQADGPKRRRRVGFVNSHPIQYFVPLYRRINQSADVEAVPIYLTDHSIRGDFDVGFGQKLAWDIDLVEGTDPVWVGGYHERKLDPGPLRMLAPDVWNAVRRANLDALVIHGHNFGANHIATLSAKLAGIPVFSRGETHLGLPMPPGKLARRNWLMPKYYAMLDGFLAIGTLNREFYRAMGVPEGKIHHFPYTVENDRMIAAATMDEAERRAFRARWGMREGVPVLLYASKFQQRKYPGAVIEAARILREQGLDIDVMMVGAGDLDAELRAQAAALPGHPVSFPGFINQAELPRFFGGCDIFSLPSEAEPWGLIINEAMCGAMPILASDEIGSVRDLVIEGDNGMLHKAGDARGMAEALAPLLRDPELIRRMGARSLERIKAWNYDLCVDGLRAALASVGK